MEFKLNASARIKAAKTMFPWAKEMFAIIKKADSKANSDDMSFGDGYWTSVKTAKKIETALKAAGYKAKKTPAHAEPGTVFESKNDKKVGVTISYPEDEDDAVLHFFNEDM